jgi:indole-3-acetate monooxygenase
MYQNNRAVDAGADYLLQARALGPVLAANADEIERSGEFPGTLVATLRDKRFFRLLQPRSIGGLELDPVSYVPIIEEIASHDASTAWCLGQNNGCSMTAAYLEPAVAKDIFGPDDGILAWGPGPATIERVPGGYRLSGNWSFASGSHHATWLGAHVPEPDAHGAIRTLLFPKSSAEMKAIWRVIGLRGTGSDAYSVADLFVPEEYTVLRGPGIRARETGPLYRFTRGNLYAAGFAGVALGIARGMLTAFVELASEKVPRGAKGTLRENAVIQALVAESEAKLRASRSFLMDTLHQMWCEVETHGALPLHGRSTRGATRQRRFIMLPARPRFSTKIPSNADSGICTRRVSSRKAAPSISNRSGRSCSGWNRKRPSSPSENLATQS